MADNNTSLAQLTSFLNKLFQFESQDLDFGVYKILHYKRKEIKQFIDKLLVDDVQNQLKSLSDDDLQNTRKELSELEKSTPIKKWLEAIEKNDSTRLEIYQEDYKEEISKYNELQKQIKEAQVSVETENLIYNHLTTFFSRYYDKGDFISKRRFGKNEKYVVPYNGEETHFYWANHDQYYIKSSETFQKFSFKINQQPNDLIVHFKLTEAQVEQGNVKSDENRYFILSEKEPELQENELSIFFEYRVMTDDEKKRNSGNNKQDKLDEEAAKFLREKLKDKTITAKLWETVNEESVLLKKLHHYTRKNKYDFFIHKNLKGFLQRELDFYIKSELLNVDDLYVSESDTHFENIRHNLKIIKVFKHIADTIIEFLAQIEDFQKKLWEKKKFVLSTDWIITIDRLIDYVGEVDAKPILQEAIENKKQINEWNKLFGKENIPEKNLTVDSLKADLHFWRKLPIDTVHFSRDFSKRLISIISKYQNLEIVMDGFALKSDNFHGLTSLQNKFHEKISLVYTDPPYNTGKDGFIYKDGFSHSTWNSFIQQTSFLSHKLITGKGLQCVSISDIEVGNLKPLLSEVFGEQNFVANLIWNNEGNIDNQKRIKVNHEYIMAFAKENKSFEAPKVIAPDIDPSKSKLFNERIENTITKNGSKNPKSEIILPIGFPCTLNEKEFKIRNDKWPHILSEFNVKEYKTIGESKFYSGWSSLDLLKDYIKNDFKPIADNKGLETTFKITESGAIYVYKERKDSSHVLSIIRNVGNVQKTSSYLSDMGFDFTYPKPIDLIKYIVQFTNEKDGYFLDYFAGSGTIFHSIQLLNRQEKKNKKQVTNVSHLYKVLN